MKETAITDYQKALLQLENYNICKLFNNSVLGVFIGLISGMGIEVFMNQADSKEATCFIVCCITSVTLLMLSMGLNSNFNTKCNQEIHKLRNACDAKTKTVKKNVKYKNGFIGGYYITFCFSLIVFGYGLYILKSVMPE
jgi:uncharacterized protein YacL